MANKSSQTIVVALFTSAALIGFAFYQRYVGPVQVSEATFYIAAAIICVSPGVHRKLRCKTCENKASSVG